MVRLFIVVCVFAGFISCGNRQQVDEIIEVSDADTLCSCPRAEIYLQPYNKFGEKEITRLLPVLQDEFDNLLYGHWNFHVLPSMSLPDSTYVKSANRYKATAILRYEQKFLRGNEVIIGLTHEDICMDIHGKKNYGIIGCSFRPGQVCVVSDRRLGNKKDLWKPVMHEFIHAFYGAPHCPEDNDTCLMQDARGKAVFSNKEGLCGSCMRQ